tara:strand:- start:33 stop:218 length:186 start_codon:yes stop_codon:yes gene_type:complete
MDLSKLTNEKITELDKRLYMKWLNAIMTGKRCYSLSIVHGLVSLEKTKRFKVFILGEKNEC